MKKGTRGNIRSGRDAGDASEGTDIEILKDTEL